MFRKICVWAAVFAITSASAQDDPQKILPCAFVDLVVIFDRSGSMQDPQKNELTKRGMVDFSTDYALSRANGLQIGIGIFTAVPRILAELTDDRKALVTAMKHFPTPSKGTSITAGMSVARDIFLDQLTDPSQEHRRKAKKVLVFFSDGESDEGDFSTARSIALDLSIGTWAEEEDENIPVTIHVVRASSKGRDSSNDASMSSLASPDGIYLVGSYERVYDYLRRFNICG